MKHMCRWDNSKISRNFVENADFVEIRPQKSASRLQNRERVWALAIS